MTAFTAGSNAKEKNTPRNEMQKLHELFLPDKMADLGLAAHARLFCTALKEAEPLTLL